MIAELRKHDTDEVLDFARRWFRYGGGPAIEIMAGLGLTQLQFFTALLEALDTDPPADLGEQVIGEMRRVARHRIWLIS
ncbi:hypothetical protein ACQP04_23075 [Pseudonocardia halophobica]|uniref:hypothetical protein n=1 Tax=Pseudonocardia halophobica TaxID=29401 RepID=UPI003D91D1D0